MPKVTRALIINVSYDEQKAQDYGLMLNGEEAMIRFLCEHPNTAALVDFEIDSIKVQS